MAEEVIYYEYVFIVWLHLFTRSWNMDGFSFFTQTQYFTRKLFHNVHVIVWKRVKYFLT
jgi:hypothetical protein